MPRIDQQSNYRIKIDGWVGNALADRLDPTVIITTEERVDAVTTTLSGLQLDQAGLVGLVRHLHGLGMVMLSVERMEHATEGEPQ